MLIAHLLQSSCFCYIWFFFVIGLYCYKCVICNYWVVLNSFHTLVIFVTLDVGSKMWVCIMLLFYCCATVTPGYYGCWCYGYSVLMLCIVHLCKFCIFGSTILSFTMFLLSY